jgi:D-alanyl-D-alanine carboxypeptidase
MNVNRFVHDRSVSLLAGKTGFTAAAGYCLPMAEEFGGQVFALVVLNARDREARAHDMNALRQFTRQSLAAGPGEMIGR